jgi:hypothetical protein
MRAASKGKVPNRKVQLEFETWRLTAPRPVHAAMLLLRARQCPMCRARQTTSRMCQLESSVQYASECLMGYGAPEALGNASHVMVVDPNLDFKRRRQHQRTRRVCTTRRFYVCVLFAANNMLQSKPVQTKNTHTGESHLAASLVHQSHTHNNNQAVTHETNSHTLLARRPPCAISSRSCCLCSSGESKKQQGASLRICFACAVFNEHGPAVV